MKNIQIEWGYSNPKNRFICEVYIHYGADKKKYFTIKIHPPIITRFTYDPPYPPFSKYCDYPAKFSLYISFNFIEIYKGEIPF